MPIVTGLLNPPNSVHGLGMGLLNRSAGGATAQFVAAASGGRTDGAEITTVTTTPAVGELIIVYLNIADWDETNLDVTDNNSDGLGTYSEINHTTLDGTHTISAWVRDALVGSATSTNFSVTAVNQTACVVGVLRFSGVTKTGLTAIRQENTNIDTSAVTPSVSFAGSTLTSNIVVAGVGSGDTTQTPPATFTERVEANQATPTTALEVATVDSGFASSTITWGAASSTDWVAVAFEIDTSP